jgi:hypothetical protein
VPFQELAGFPVEQYTLAGFRARRQFLVAWDDRDAFARELLGTAAQHGGSVWLSYPGKPTVVAVSLRYEPLNPRGLDVQTLGDLTEGLNRYSGSFAKATVEYRTVNTQDRDDGPHVEPGTHLTYRMEFVVEREKLLPGGWTWADNGQAVSGGLELWRAVPMTDHVLTWHQVLNPPWNAIRALQGKLNAAEFLGCPAGTVLFLGAEANKLYRGGFETEPSAFCWRIRYVFRERAVKHAGAVYGWNHVWRDNPAGWAELTAGANRLYESADLAALFPT